MMKKNSCDSSFQNSKIFRNLFTIERKIILHKKNAMKKIRSDFFLVFSIPPVFFLAIQRVN